VVQHEQAVRFAVPGLTARGRVVRPFVLTRVLRRWLAKLPLWILRRLLLPDWLMLWMLLESRPTVVRAAEPNDQAVGLARALAPVRMEGVWRRPWLVVGPRRVGVFAYVVGEAVERWSGTPFLASVVRQLKGFSVRLEFLDGSTAVIAISETEARTLPRALSATSW
jgi:hypothetical protein